MCILLYCGCNRMMKRGQAALTELLKTVVRAGKESALTGLVFAFF
jgi:hypothetical protein